MTPFRPGGLSERAAAEANELARWRESMRHPVVSGAFGLTYGADGRPIIYGVGVAAGAETPADLTVCGTALSRRLARPTDAACPPCDTANYVTTYHPRGITLDPCAFRVSGSSTCGAGAGAGSTSTAGPPGVLIETQGFTGVWPTPWDVVFCTDTCSIKVQWAYGCFYKGLFLGYWLGPPASCGSSGGSGGGAGGGVLLAKPRTVLRLGSRFAPPLPPVDPSTLPDEVRQQLPASGGSEPPGPVGRAAGKFFGRLVGAALAALGV